MSELVELCMTIHCPKRIECKDWFVHGLDNPNIALRDYFGEKGCMKDKKVTK